MVSSFQKRDQVGHITMTQRIKIMITINPNLNRPTFVAVDQKDQRTNRDLIDPHPLPLPHHPKIRGNEVDRPRNVHQKKKQRWNVVKSKRRRV
jgi:hypothetical protein